MVDLKHVLFVGAVLFDLLGWLFCAAIIEDSIRNSWLHGAKARIVLAMVCAAGILVNLGAICIARGGGR